MKLSIRTPGRERRVVNLDRAGIVIGRSSSCDVVVRERSVSSRHVQILAGPIVIDLGSTNGTFVDGHRIEGITPLVDGQFCLGGPDDVVIEVLPEDEDPATVDRAAKPEPSEPSGRLEDALAIYLAWKDHGLETPEELYRSHPGLREELEAMIAEEPAAKAPAPPQAPEEQVLRALDRILASPNESQVGVWALGAVLSYLCTGIFPTPPSRRAVHDSALDDAQDELAKLIERALDPRVDRRFATIDEMVQAFGKVVSKKAGRGLFDRLRGPKSSDTDT